MGGSLGLILTLARLTLIIMLGSILMAILSTFLPSRPYRQRLKERFNGPVIFLAMLSAALYHSVGSFTDPIASFNPVTFSLFAPFIVAAPVFLVGGIYSRTKVDKKKVDCFVRLDVTTKDQMDSFWLGHDSKSAKKRKRVSA